MSRGVESVVRRLVPALVSLVLASCSAEGSGTGVVLLPDTTVAAATTVARQSYSGTEAAPEFPDGLDWLNVPQPLSLAALRGKVVLLDFWTYGCINCIHIIPDLERLEAEYPDELVVIGVHSAKFDNEGDTANIRSVIARYGLTHPVVNDRDFAVWDQWGVNAWPTVVVVDPAGNIVGGHSGEGIYPILQPVVESLVVEFDGRGLIDRTPVDLEPTRPPNTVLSFPGKVQVDAAGGRLFVADTNHHRVVIADLDTGRVLDVAGSGAAGFAEGGFDEARFDQPQGMALSGDGETLFVADLGNHAIRALDLVGRTVITLVGTGEQAPAYPPVPGTAPAVALDSPWDLLLVDELLYVAMAGSHQIWTLDLASGRIEPVAGSGAEGVGGGAAGEVSLAQPSGLATDGAGTVYFADAESSSIRFISDDRVGLLAGGDGGLFDFGLVDATGRGARFQHPLGVAYTGGAVFVADTYNSVIRRIDAATGAVTTFAGSTSGWRDGAAARFDEPGGIAAAGNRLYVADTNNHAIRVIDLTTGVTTTLVLYGIEAFRAPLDEAAPVLLGAVALAPGEATLTIDIRLPDGYVMNDLAPFSLEWRGEGVGVEPGEMAVVAPGFPIEVVLAGLVPSVGTLVIDVTTYFCTAATKELCLIDQVRLALPVTVTTGAASSAAITHGVPAPAA
jgi:DNA-binding beta-propeller fold protein YncE